jgi:hypothetical protein
MRTECVRAVAAAILAVALSTGCRTPPTPTATVTPAQSGTTEDAGFTSEVASPEAAEAFRTLCATRIESVPEATMTVPGSDGWLFLRSELRHIGAGRFWGDAARAVSRASNPENADPQRAILDFARQLNELDVELFVVPVPPKAVVYADKLSGAISPGADDTIARYDTFHREFYDLLRNEGVRVVDVAPLLIAKRSAPEGNSFCKQDTHYSGVACVAIAEMLAGELTKRGWYKGHPKTALRSAWRDVEIKGDLWGGLNDLETPPETLKLRFVGAGDDVDPVPPDRASPVLLIGDSHTLVFHAGDDMHVRGAGLADQLALELGFAVDLIGVRGSGATPSRVNLYRRGNGASEYIMSKKALIWCFTAREFTEGSGWSIVPVCKETAAPK